MKKVLVAGAALMIAGALVVPTAWAEITLGGDARVRYIGQSGFDTIVDRGTHVTTTSRADYRDRFTNRIRINLTGVAEGGAFAKTRIRLNNSPWVRTDGDFDEEGNRIGSRIRDSRNEVRFDFAFVGIPMGSITAYAGMVNDGLSDFSDFFHDGENENRVQVEYDGEGFDISAFYQISAEGWHRANRRDDASSVGLMAGFDLADNMNLSTFLWYVIDDYHNRVAGVSRIPTNASKSGFQGSLRFEGEFDAIGLEAELSFRADNLQDNQNYFVNDPADGAGPDSGIGGIVGVTYSLGAFTPGIKLGFTQDGFAPHEDYGFMMIGGDDPLQVVTLGDARDQFWAAFTAGYRVSERLRLSGNLVYLDVSDAAFINGVDGDAIELSGNLTYMISPGASIGYNVGWLSGDIDNTGTYADIDIDAVGHFVQLGIRF